MCKKQEKEKQKQRKSYKVDRMGFYIGMVCQEEDIRLRQLSEGLCGVSFLSRIARGEREAEKLLMDTILERLGRPAGMFERILPKEEIKPWLMREQIQDDLRRGRLPEAEKWLLDYQGLLRQKKGEGVCLHKQFARIMNLNIRYQREGISAENQEELCQEVLSALRLTQPSYGKKPLASLLMSRNEIYLVRTILWLKKRIEGWKAVREEYQILWNYLQSHFKERELRVCVLPFIAYDRAEGMAQEGNKKEALLLCSQAIEELEGEKRLFYRKECMALGQRLLQELGQEWFQELQSLFCKTESLWIPYEEGHDVYYENLVLKSRRKMLGFSIEKMAEDCCDKTSVWRMEKEGTTLQREKRKQLLQKVYLSGEQYDYEIITEDYRDYQLRSQMGRALNTSQWEKAGELLTLLKARVPATRTNQQYIKMAESDIKSHLPEGDPEKLSLEERIEKLKQALADTQPRLELEPEKLAVFPVGMLSLNETVILKQLASCYKKQKRFVESRAILEFIKRCMEYEGERPVRDEDLYTLCMVELVDVLGECGEYEAADKLGKTCLEVMFMRQTYMRMASCLFSMAWNTEQQETQKTLSDPKIKEKCLALLHMAYRITHWTKNTVGQRYLEKYAKEVYGVELEF